MSRLALAILDVIEWECMRLYCQSRDFRRKPRSLSKEGA